MEANIEKLKYVINFYVESFNDCACCPLYPYECEGRCDLILNTCATKIIRWLGDCDEVMSPQKNFKNNA